MKKLMCLALGVSMIGAMIVVAGCGGGGGIGAIIGVGLLVLSLTAAGPAAVPFAASIKGQTISNKYIAIISPTGRTATWTEALYVQNNVIKFDNLQCEASTDGQYKVEIYPNPRGSASPIFKCYFNQIIADGETKDIDKAITASDTAKALIYDNWPSSSTVKFESFEQVVATASINTIAANIITTMQNTNGVYSSNYNIPGSIIDDATDVANETKYYDTSSLVGWWLLTPSYMYPGPLNPHEVSGIYYSNTGNVTAWSAFDATYSEYTIDANGNYTTNLTVANTSITATGTLTSPTAGTYSAKNISTQQVVESGTIKKISYPEACQGTWIGSQGALIGDLINVNSSGLITNVTDPEGATDYTGFMIADGNLPVAAGEHIPALIYAKSPSRSATSPESRDNEIVIYGSIFQLNGKQVFSGTVETDNPGEESPSGSVLFEKQ